MFNTKHGLFDGTSWESLCQQVFRYKHHADGYQPITTSPGDFGLEGYTVHSGIGFQCYCPEKNYSTDQLFTKQQAKITKDIKKLKTYQTELSSRLGSTKIKEWHFVTPVIAGHKLLAHAKAKEKEVLGWGLPFISDEFTIHLRDADFYLPEINQIRANTGSCLTFDDAPPTLEELAGPMQEYESNIIRKSRARIGLTDEFKSQLRATALSELTKSDFLESTPYLKKIEAEAPLVYIRIIRTIKEFEIYVKEKSITWSDTPEALTTNIREELYERVNTDLRGLLDNTESSKIARYFVSRWLAICQLDFID